MENDYRHFETVEDFFWGTKDVYEPLYLIGRGLLNVFKHPDAVYLKNLRVVEERLSGMVRVHMTVHNASEYDYDDHVIEKYHFEYNKDDITSWISLQYDDLDKFWEEDKEWVEDIIANEAFVKQYVKDFRESGERL